MTAEELFYNLYDEYGDDFHWTMIALTNKYFVDQANKEIKPGHFLYGRTMYSVAKCDSNDDVLFVTDNQGKDLYAIVHLTYSNYDDVEYPQFTLLEGIGCVEQYMRNEIGR